MCGRRQTGGRNLGRWLDVGVERAIDGWRAVGLLGAARDLPLQPGVGYRWQRLCFLLCLGSALPLLLGAPAWLCLAVAAAGLGARGWGVMAGGLMAALVVWWGEWVAFTGLACLAMAAWYGWQALLEARAVLLERIERDPAFHARALAAGAAEPGRF